MDPGNPFPVQAAQRFAVHGNRVRRRDAGLLEPRAKHGFERRHVEALEHPMQRRDTGPPPWRDA
jgi:hypothetical protein